MLTANKLQNCNPEVWGGFECTINRVGEKFIDQFDHSGNYVLDKANHYLVDLGIKKVRFPILWEKHEPIEHEPINWTWAETNLNDLRNKHIEPIAGLLHHGSGPGYTDLLDINFPEKFAAYAGKVARKFPWIDLYTPINEPLTTARFSGLYGYWYPHSTNDISFAKMVINQLKAVVLAMREIRKVNPAAKLIQTEDLGKTFCTPGLGYQAIFENERRWLTFDILSGKFQAGHRIRAYFKRLGIDEDSMDFFLRNPCPPDIIGINYYITSERFLDEDEHKYPIRYRGGNEIQNYADVEAARVSIHEPHGLKHLLEESWERYKLPIAITEVHLGCSREEQMRWFKEAWETCKDLKSEKKIDLRAITPWALMGSFGWNHLLTAKKMDYEPGAYDVRAKVPRLTALGKLIQNYSLGLQPDHPFLEAKGWWHREIRLYENQHHDMLDKFLPEETNSSPLLIIGKTGTLGQAFAKICNLRNINYLLLSRQDMDITDAQQVDLVIKKYQPWAVINAAGYVRVDDAENEIDLCFSQNAVGPQNLATACKKYGAKFLTFSSDLVFDGSKESPYFESDKTDPLNTYGWSKAHAEKEVMSLNPDALIIRSSSFFGPWDNYNFVSGIITSLASNQPVDVMNDVRMSPTFVPDLVNHSLDLMIDDEAGIWHLSNEGDLSWWEFAKEIALRAGLDHQLVKPVSIRSLQLKASRPTYSVLTSEKASLMPTVDDAIDRYLKTVSHKDLHVLTEKK